MTDLNENELNLCLNALAVPESPSDARRICAYVKANSIDRFFVVFTRMAAVFALLTALGGFYAGGASAQEASVTDSLNTYLTDFLDTTPYNVEL